MTDSYHNMEVPEEDKVAPLSITTHLKKRMRPSYHRETTREYFREHTSDAQKERNKENQGSEVRALYVGIAIAANAAGKNELGLAIHDGTYLIDFMIETLEGILSNPSSASSSISDKIADKDASELKKVQDELAQHIIKRIANYRKSNLAKFIGAGMTNHVTVLCPGLTSLLWAEHDIIPFVFKQIPNEGDDSKSQIGYRSVDEDSAWLAAKTVRRFGPNRLPHLMIGYGNIVDVDCRSRYGVARLTNTSDYENTVHPNTWTATMKYAASLKEHGTKIAFINSTPQGGGVALMRHALIRFLHSIGVDCTWYVPNPRADVFRITKNNHNILQGIETDENLRLKDEDIAALDAWARHEAEPRWTKPGAPLAARSKGGADIIIIDDPQLPSLVKIAKEKDPQRPVIYRSHIQVRADLANDPSELAHGVWKWVWDNVKDCDVFVSHPIKQFIPNTVPTNKIGYLPATTDWLDGLNINMPDRDKAFHLHRFGQQCMNKLKRELAYPGRPYIAQIARFDPAKGIPTVLAAYTELRRTYMKDSKLAEIPQLVIAGHGAVDDPDATIIYDQTMSLLETLYPEFEEDVMVMRLGPSDQVLNAIISCAHVVLQLSTREGFEVKVSEALHKGIPVIATLAGGIPLQVQHKKSGFLVNPEDFKAVAEHLNHLFTDKKLYRAMSAFAAKHVSDEVSTVGNALAWLYLADSLTQGEDVQPHSRWINDMARDRAGVPYAEDETKLPRRRSDLVMLEDLESSYVSCSSSDEDE